jgi:LmbE family N-acetylglucosaminyl deacetylase
MTLVISPHCDDAILSLGQYLATEPATVLTVFAGTPEGGCTPYDRARGFPQSRRAMYVRRKEDRAACELLGCDTIQMDFYDHQYSRPSDDEQITNAIRARVQPDELVFVPLGIGHPDHEQVARCTRAMFDSTTLIIYEELPYRVLNPEQVTEAFAKIRAEGWTVGDLPYPLPQGPRERKVAAIGRYASQFPDGADDPCLLVPERAWRIAR